jgi:hypothetical protein
MALSQSLLNSPSHKHLEEPLDGVVEDLSVLDERPGPPQVVANGS